MIKYRAGSRCTSFIARAIQCRGSVFPFAFCVALPAAALTALVKIVTDLGHFIELREVLTNNAAWSGFVFLVGFLSVFRTSQAYARFWEGVSAMHQMRAEWFDAYSCLVAFSRNSKASEPQVLEFQQILVRLYSMLHAVALAEIEERNGGNKVVAFSYELLDAGGLDRESIKTLKFSEAKVELVFQWIQQLVVDNVYSNVLSIPPPILSRAFQELANGMAKFHEALKISTVPFPFPYTQTCECLLIMHWVCTPFVVAQWVSSPWWGALFSFLQVFVYWSLNIIALEIEQPFGTDANDLDARMMQVEFNGHLLLLLDSRTKRTPTLSPGLQEQTPSHGSDHIQGRHSSFDEVWVSERISGTNSDRGKADGKPLDGLVSRHSGIDILLPRSVLQRTSVRSSQGDGDGLQRPPPSPSARPAPSENTLRPPEATLRPPVEAAQRPPIEASQRAPVLPQPAPAIAPVEAPPEATGDPLHREGSGGAAECSCDNGARNARAMAQDPCHLLAAPTAAPRADEEAPLDTGSLAVQFSAPHSTLRPSHWSSSLSVSQGQPRNLMVSPWRSLKFQGRTTT